MNCKTGVILAAGEGKRMKSALPKVLHQVCGREMVKHVSGVLTDAGVENVIIVVGHGAEEVKAAFSGSGVSFALQAEQLGTGHAVMQAEPQIPSEGNMIVLCGDTPLITAETISKMAAEHEKSGAFVTVLTAEEEDPAGYGRIIRGADGKVSAIVEEKDADEAQKAVKEINSGMYCFDCAFLKEKIGTLSSDNAQKEYYLTDLVAMAAAGGKASAYMIADNTEILGVNDRVQLAKAEKIMQARINEAHMRNGVTFIDPDCAYIDAGVEIGQDTTIYPGAILKGKTKIGTGCTIGHNCRIEDSEVGCETDIQSSTILESRIGDKTHVGPYAYMRPGSSVGNECKVGDFVELKNASLGNRSKSAHLAYIGDADVGEDCNIGCGVVFVNYDGVNKHRSVVKDRAFVGSNANVVAPVTLHEDAYIAAGTTVTVDIAPGALCIGRTRESQIEGWVESKGLLRGSRKKK